VSGGGGAMPRSTKLPAFSLHLSQPIPALRSLSLSVYSLLLYRPRGPLAAAASYCVRPAQASSRAGRLQTDRERTQRGDGLRKMEGESGQLGGSRHRASAAAHFLRRSSREAPPGMLLLPPCSGLCCSEIGSLVLFFQAVIFTRLSLFLIRVFRDSAFAGDWIGGMVGVDGWVWLVG